MRRVREIFEKAPASFVWGDDPAAAISDGRGAVVQVHDAWRAGLVCAIASDDELMSRQANLIVLFLLAAGWGASAASTAHYAALMMTAARMTDKPRAGERARRGDTWFTFVVDRENGLITVNAQQDQPVKRGKPREER